MSDASARIIGAAVVAAAGCLTYGLGEVAGALPRGGGGDAKGFGGLLLVVGGILFGLEVVLAYVRQFRDEWRSDADGKADEGPPRRW